MVVPLQVQIRYFNLLPASANGAALCCYTGCSLQWTSGSSRYLGRHRSFVGERNWTPFTNGNAAAVASRTRAAPDPVPD